MRKQNGFTIMELLVVFTLMLILLGVILGGNYYFQIKKGMDSRRKQDLASIQRMVEDYYADKHVYPSVSDMTYATMDDTTEAGKICGYKHTGASLSPYTKELPCSSDSPLNDYIYFTANERQDYAIFTMLANKSDVDTDNSGCSKGCSYFTNPSLPQSTVSNNYFNYQVTSPSYVLIPCPASEYIACYPQTGTPCRRCPLAQCTGYARLYCTPTWCSNYCQ